MGHVRGTAVDVLVQGVELVSWPIPHVGPAAGGSAAQRAGPFRAGAAGALTE